MAGKFLKNCGYCSTEFKGRLNSVFCSTSCRSNHWQKNKNWVIKNFNPKLEPNEIHKYYVADNGYSGVLSCKFCKKNNKIGLFYFNLDNKIKCNTCGLTYSMD
jgi:hypothetical protein